MFFFLASPPHGCWTGRSLIIQWSVRSIHDSTADVAAHGHASLASCASFMNSPF